MVGIIGTVGFPDIKRCELIANVMPRYGKIARLPRTIREGLNCGLDNNEPGVRLVQWLNSLPEVKKILETDFGGREITQQNLTKWKAHGYLEWQRQQEALALTQELNANARELAESGGQLADSLARVVAARYAAVLYGWDGEMTDEMERQLRGLAEVYREVVRLRRSEQFLEHVKIQQEWLALKRKATGLNEKRYNDSMRSNEEKALQFCLDATKRYPEVTELFKAAFAALEKATEGK